MKYPVVESFPGPRRPFRASAFAGRPIPPRQWFVDGLIPAAAPTIISADGGTGKSRLVLQAAVATVTGKGWLAWSVKQGPVIYLSAEDSEDEVHRRLHEACLFYDVGLEDLTDLHVWDLTTDDPALALQEDGDRLKPTPRWEQLCAEAEAIRPAMIALDSLADVFGGNEISRQQARQFIGMLRGLAIRTGAAIVIIAHPSLSGMSSGSGSSGSTHWHNSVRSRLYLTRSGDGVDADPDLLTLSLKKSNYARAIPDLRIRSKIGGFIVEDQGLASFDMGAAQGRVDRLFLELMAAYEAEGRSLSDSTGRNFAPYLFAQDGRAKGTTKTGFVGAMNRLFAAGQIRVETVGTGSHQRRKLVRVEVAP